MRNVLVVILWALSLEAAAVSVSPNPLLPSGISLDFPGLGWQPVLLSDAERPNGLIGSLGVIHLGTNSDVFINPANEYWVRYTLDSTSLSTYEYSSDVTNTPLTGEFWLSFKKTNSGYRVDSYVDQIDGVGHNSPSTYIGVFDANRYSSSHRDEWQSFATGSLFFRAFTGEGGTSLNLSFLTLKWDGAKYMLETSSVGFDQVFYEWASEGAYGTVSLNIAPVPLPGSVNFLLTGLAGLIGARRFRK